MLKTYDRTNHKLFAKRDEGWTSWKEIEKYVSSSKTIFYNGLEILSQELLVIITGHGYNTAILDPTKDG